MKKGVITLIVVLCATVAALGAIGSLSLRRPSPQAEQRRVIADADRIRAELSERIATDGLEATYKAIRADRDVRETDAKHGRAHIFGELAYEKEGIPAIRVCDGSMTFGCYHGLIVRALVTEGLDAVPKLDAACRAALGEEDTGCRHGIGHGLVEYFGARDLASALDRCAAIQPPNLLGCTQGVFMEFSNAAVEDPSLIDDQDPERPCNSVAPEHRRSCYFEQPYVWMLRAGIDSLGAKDRCLALAEPALKESCLLGFGRAVSELGRYDGIAVDRECGRLADEDARMTCLGGARWLFAATMKLHPWPCDELPPADKAACIAKAKIVSDVEPKN